MTYNVNLSITDLPGSQPYIANFFRYVVLKDDSRLNSNTINSELKEYNAIYIEHDYDIDAHIEFASREDYVIFLLRWA